MSSRKRTVRFKNPIVRITPRMKVALSLLLTGDRLEFGCTCVGRPTKQKLAKCGFAKYTGAEKDWDGPMEITDKGRSIAGDMRL